MSSLYCTFKNMYLKSNTNNTKLSILRNKLGIPSTPWRSIKNSLDKKLDFRIFKFSKNFESLVRQRPQGARQERQRDPEEPKEAPET